MSDNVAMKPAVKPGSLDSYGWLIGLLVVIISAFSMGLLVGAVAF